MAMRSENPLEVVKDFLSRQPLEGYELEAYVESTLVPALQRLVKPPEQTLESPEITEFFLAVTNDLDDGTEGAVAIQIAQGVALPVGTPHRKSVQSILALCHAHADQSGQRIKLVRFTRLEDHVHVLPAGRG